jgi:5-carboxyvanillate decarboxylase
MWYSPEIWMPHGKINEGKLLDLGDLRIKDMDEAGLDVQVLSLSAPGCEQFEPREGTALARETNNELSLALKKYPQRFIGLAALAPQDPGESAKELERSVKELGMKGAKINSNIRGEYLDDQKYWPIFEKAEQLRVPIYLHPTIPSPAMLQPYSRYGVALAGPTLGFGAETALHVMRLIFSGVFDKYPGLKIILGHLGEGLPFWMHRIDYAWLQPWMNNLRPNIARKPSEYLKTNFMVTTSGMTSFPAFLCTLMTLGADNIAFATDYPYDSTKESVELIKSLQIADSDKEKVFNINAFRIFK